MTDTRVRAAPTGLTLTKVQDKDEDGTIRTFIKMECTAPTWATPKTDYEFEVTAGGVVEVVKSGDTEKRYRVQKTRVLHSVRVRAKMGTGQRGSWTGAVTITPTKKGADASAVTGVDSHKKNGNIVVKWNASTDPDNREFIVKRATSNSYAAAVEVGRTKGTRYIDTDVNTKNTTYYYFIDPIDTSGNVGAASAATSQTETGIGTSDTDAAVLAAPTGISLVQANRDVDQDGKVDIALRTTFSGGVANAAGYEVWWEDNAGQSATARADSGSWWFPANTIRTYRVRWRTINWVGEPGPWSAYTSYVAPAPTAGSPSTPTGISVTAYSFGWYLSFTAPTENDYDFTEIAVASPSAANIIASTKASKTAIMWPGVSATALYLRHVNTSGLRSAWSAGVAAGATFLKDSDVSPGTLNGSKLIDDTVGRAKLIAGAAGNVAHANLGTTMGSVNVGSGYTRTLLTLSFKCTNTTSGITVNLGSYSTTIDFANGQQITITTAETGGGSFSASKSGGAISGCQLSAVGVY